MQSTTGTGLRLISFDGGGARALSQLKIVETMMHRIQYDLYPNDPDKTVLPYECFDMMGGSDMGGAIAIMFSKLRMSVEDVMDECHRICSKVYVDDISSEERSLRLRQCIEELLERRELPLDLKLGKDSRLSEEGCPCFVVATLKSSMNNKVKLRTYRTRAEPMSNVTVVEAILATCAMQPTFKPISVGSVLSGQELVGGALGLGNPCRELVLEAFDKCKGDSQVSTILSIGIGHPGTLSAPDKDRKGEWMDVLRAMVTSCEETSRSMEMQMGHLGVYFRFSVDQELQRHHERHVNNAGWLMSQTQAYLQEVEVSRRLDQCIESLRLRQGLVTLERLRSVHSQTIYKDIPALTTYFVMRKAPWEKMMRLLDQENSASMQRVLVVSGMAGCGKTQLLIHFTKEFRSRFRHVFFVDASSKERIQADLINHVRTADPASSQATFSDVLSFFSNSRNLPWLIAYDNCDDVELDLHPLLPDCSHGSIIITTRNRSRGQFASESELHLELDVMSDEEAIEVIMQSARLQDLDRNRKSAASIAKELGNLPVALAQAGSYIFQTSCTCIEYLQLLCKSKLEMMSIPTADRHHRSAYVAFDLAYRRLPSHVQNFLHLIGCLHYANFPMAAIKIAAEVQFRTESFDLEDHDERFEECISLLTETFCPDGLWDDLTPHKISQTLQSYSLASFTRTTVTSLLRMHPLLHEWAFQRLHSSRKTLFRLAASRLIVCASTEISLPQYLVGHINVLLPEPTISSIPLNDRGALGRILQDLERFEDSRRIWQDVYNRVVETNEGSQLRVATATIELANTFYDNLLEMERLEKEAIRIREEQLGSEHADTLYAQGQLTGTYERQGRLDEAVKLREEIQEILNKKFGLSHLETAKSMHYLVRLYVFQHRYSEAEQLEQQVLKIRKEKLGENDPETLRAMHNLAMIYRYLGRDSDAQPLQEQVLNVRQERLGDTHPETLLAMHTLGSTYYSLGRYSDARKLQEQELNEQKERLGDSHPDTLTSAHQLALTCYKQGRYSEARQLQEKVLENFRLGDDHQKTVTAMRNLAWTYYRLEQLTQARELAVEAERIETEVLGTGHPSYQKTTDLLKAIDAALARSKSIGTPTST